MKGGARFTALLLLAVAARMASGQEAAPQEAGGQPPVGQEPGAQPAPGQQPGAPDMVPGGAPVVKPNYITPFGSLGAVYSDNLEHTTSNPTTGAALDALAGVNVRHAGTFSLNADISALYREYVGVNLPGQLLPSVNATGTAVAIPERLFFTAQDTLGQISTQAFDALSDSTRQNSNFFTFGPEFLLPLGDRNVLRTDLEYGRSTFQDSNIGNSRYSGDIGLGRMVGESSTLSVNYRYEQIDYVYSDLYPRVTDEVAYLRYSVEGSRTYLAAEAGRDDVKVEAENENRTAPHILLALQRRLTPLMTLTAEYNHGTSDASETLRADSQNGFNTGNTLDVQAVAQPFTVDRAYVMLLRTGPFGTVAVQATTERDKYEQDTLLNRTERGADLIIDHRLAPLWTLAGSARWQHGKYDNTGVLDDRLLFSLGLTRQISSSFQAALVVEHNRGTGLDSTTGSYTENRVTLLLHYSPQRLASQVFDPVNQFRYYQRPDHQTSSQDLNPFSTPGP
jgi:hypothetical protein